MANIHHKPISNHPVPQCIRSVAKFVDKRHRRKAAKNLPWSRLNDAQRALAVQVIAVGKDAYIHRG